MTRTMGLQAYGLKITTAILVLFVAVCTWILYGNMNRFDQVWIKNLKNASVSNCYEDVYKDLSKALVSKYPNTKRYFIYKCQRFCGGLADRQKGIVGAYLLSLLTNRTFGIIHTTPMPIRDFVRPKKVNWEIPKYKLKGLSFQEQFAVSNFTFVKKLPSLNLTTFYSKDIIYFHGNLEYVSALRRHYNAPKIFPIIMSMSNSEVYRSVLKLLFTPSRNLAKDINSTYKKIGNRKLICAHVRMGRNEAMPIDKKVKLTINETRKIWEFLDNYRNSYANSIFVASDSNEIKALARNRYNTQYIDVPGKIIHIDQIRHTEVKITEGMKKVFLEQTLLSLCDVLVITNSGFGRIAAYLRNKSRGLYCYLNNLVFPCNSDLLDQLYSVR